MKKIPNAQYVQMEIPNLSVLDSAEQYYDGAIILKKQPPLSGVLLPQLTNAALAMELYAKSLNTWSIIENYQSYGNGVFGGPVKGKPRSRGHAISAIIADYIPELIEEINRMHRDLTIPFNHAELIDEFRKYDNFFENIRYSYENDCLNEFELHDFWQAVELMRLIVKSVNPIFKPIR
jgi:hypothetical protein